MADPNTSKPSEYSEMLTPSKLKAALTQKLNAPYVAVEDISGGCGQSFEAIVVSSEFEKKTALARHRLVNSALKEEIASIHAWTAKCYTPEQWEKMKAERSGTS